MLLSYFSILSNYYIEMTCGLQRAGSRRKKSHTKKHKTYRKSHHHKRRQNGGTAPVNYTLSGDWSSKMSLGQGGDFLKYHVGQHGGNHLMGAPMSAITQSSLPPQMRGPALLGGLDGAMKDIQGLQDGGRRRHRKQKKNSKKNGKKHSKKHSKKNGKKNARKNRRTRRSRGGALGFAPFPSQGMLLNSSMDYAKAGLNPEWNSVEQDAANVRASQ